MSLWKCLCFFSLSLLLALSLFHVNLLGRLPWLLIGSWSCHSSLSDMTSTYPLPVKFPLADKRTLKGVNGDLFCALYLLSFYSFLTCFICYSFMPKSFVFCFDILDPYNLLICHFIWLICYFVTRMALLFDELKLYDVYSLPRGRWIGKMSCDFHWATFR